MKITFIAETGVGCDPFSRGKIDYDNESEFISDAQTEHDRDWSIGDDASISAGYEDIIAANRIRLRHFEVNISQFMTHLKVPYGYLVLTR